MTAKLISMFWPLPFAAEAFLLGHPDAGWGIVTGWAIFAIVGISIGFYQGGRE